jgi:hypothetical protein
LSLPAEQIGSASASHGGGRAFGLGPHVVALIGSVVVGLVLLVVVVGVLLAGHSGSAAKHNGTASTHGKVTGTHLASAAEYGGLPSWLPKAKVPVERVLQASPAHPALAIQGNTVSVHLAQGQVLATAVGPTVPESGRFPVPATSPCTFIVTFAAASGVVPLGPSAFTFLDEQGHVRHPRVTAMHGGALPRQVLPGRPVSLKVYDVLPTGDGGLTWAPGGGRPIVSWDFDVEID